MDTVEGKERAGWTETSTETHTVPYIKYIATRNLPYDRGIQTQCFVATQRVGGGREGTYVDVWQGPTQHCKAITFQLKNKKKKKKKASICQCRGQGSIPGPGRSHMAWGKKATCHNYCAPKPVLHKKREATTTRNPGTRNRQQPLIWLKLEKSQHPAQKT